MKKTIFLIVLMVFGLVVISAQQPVPKPPTPHFSTVTNRVDFTTISEDIAQSSSRLNQSQLQQLFELYDQRKYEEYLNNSGFLTDAESERLFNWQGNLLFMEEVAKIVGTPVNSIEVIIADLEFKKAIQKLWTNWSPGWHSQAIRECIGFALIQPQGTRATSQNERNQMIRMTLNTSSVNETFNNIKQQFESGLGVSMNYDPVNEGDILYTYVLHSSRSASGRPYWIMIQQGSFSVHIEVSELRSDP